MKFNGFRMSYIKARGNLIKFIPYPPAAPLKNRYPRQYEKRLGGIRRMS